jgi:hypothetical protein
MPQDTQINVSTSTKDRLNDYKPHFTFKNRSDLLEFFMNVFTLVKPLILQGNDLPDKEITAVISQLHRFKDKLKEPKTTSISSL